MIPITRSILSVACCAVLASSCATVAHHLVDNDTTDAGIRYYGTSPYLIAYSDGKGGVVTSVVYLPDPAKKMSASPKATLADVGSTLTFDRGTLTQATDSGDATAVPTAILKAVEAIAPSLAAIFNEPKKQDEFSLPPPYVFRIVVQGNDVSFVGGKGDTPIQVTLLPQAAKEK